VRTTIDRGAKLHLAIAMMRLPKDDRDPSDRHRRRAIRGHILHWRDGIPMLQQIEVRDSHNKARFEIVSKYPMVERGSLYENDRNPHDDRGFG
jgi:hypothetical protein